ncbi:MAG: ABC transporter permease [Planctomycetota bacterium]
MPGLLASTGLLFRAHVRRVWWSRRALACLALAAIPPVIAWIVTYSNPRLTGAEIATHLGWLLLLQVCVPLIALVTGSAVVTEEIEDRTISYLFSRPVPRPAVLLGRWSAALVLVSTLLALSAFLTVTLASRSAVPGPDAAQGILGPLLAAAVLGGAVYSALFAAAGVFFRHPMIVGLGYAFAIEGFLANLPGQNAALTVQYYLRSVVAVNGSAAWQEVPGFDLHRFSTSPVVTALAWIGATLLLASWRIARREFVLSA